MKVGDLVVHIGASPNGYRLRLVVAFGEKNHFEPIGHGEHRVGSRTTIIFIDGRYDWKDQWRTFKGWEGWSDKY